MPNHEVSSPSSIEHDPERVDYNTVVEQLLAHETDMRKNKLVREAQSIKRAALKLSDTSISSSNNVICHATNISPERLFRITSESKNASKLRFRPRERLIK